MLSMIIIGFIAALVFPLLIGILPMVLDNQGIKYFDSEFLSDEEMMFPADWNFTIAEHQVYTFEGHTVALCLCKVCALDAPKKKTTKRTSLVIFPPLPTVRPLPLGIIDMMPKNQVKPSFIRFNNNFDLSDIRMAA